MEITARADLGADLFAPTAQQGGAPYWGYELLTHVQPGDVVLHWHKELLDEPSIVGWSRATGAYEDTDIEWQARGSVGRRKGSLKARPAWRMPLESYVPLTDPLGIRSIRRREKGLIRLKDELEAKHGKPLYFPFGFSDKRPMRAQQTYFVKVPVEVLTALALSEPLEAPDLLPEAVHAPARKSSGGTGGGYMTDALVRSAIEWRAVYAAVEHYEFEAYTVEYVGNTQPYDLVVTRGQDVRRVEVKGSSGAAENIELTYGEVDNSRDFSPVDLFVLDGIQFGRKPDGTVEAFGGEARLWSDWRAADTALKAIRFRYKLPSGARDAVAGSPGAARGVAGR